MISENIVLVAWIAGLFGVFTGWGLTAIYYELRYRRGIDHSLA